MSCGMKDPTSPLRNKMAALCFAFIAFQTALPNAHAVPVLDSTFGTGGVARIGAPSGAEDTPSASTLQRDGKLLVGGWTAGRQSQVFVLRLNANGSQDSSFGKGGVALFDLPSGYSRYTITQIEQRADGSILIGAQVYQGFMFTLLTPAGALDTTFAANGFFFTASDATRFIDSARFVQQADGGILIVADATHGAQFALRLTRLTAAGARDTFFAPNGEKILTALPPDFELRSGSLVAAEPNGGFAALANATSSGGTYLLVRVTASGALDSTFGSGGLISGYDLGRPFDVPTQIARIASGKLLLLGDERNGSSASSTGKLLLWRMTANGALDTSFGVAGRVEVARSSTFSTYNDSFHFTSLVNGGIALLDFNDGNAGRTRVTRLDNSGVPDTGFGVTGSVSITLAGYDFRGIGALSTSDIGLLIPALAATGSNCLPGIPCTPLGADVAIVSLDAAGRLQAGYGRGDGVALWNNTSYSGDTVDNILVEPSGKLLLTGFSGAAATYDHLLTRLDANGAIDQSFGINGRVEPRQNAHCNGLGRAVEQPNGAIVIAAGTASGSFCQIATVTAFRVDATGLVDAGFRPEFARPSQANAAVALGVRADGRLLYGTAGYDGSAGAATLQQKLPDGTPDLSFGAGGKVVFPLAAGEGSRQADLIVLSDGSVVFAVLTTQNLRLYKVDSRGVPVATFGTAGQFYYPAAFDKAVVIGMPFSLLSLADHSLLAGIRAYAPSGSSSESLLAIRISDRGTLIGANNLLADERYLDWNFAALPDASVVIARSRRESNGTSSAALYRLLPDNSFDAGFGVGGTYPLPGVLNVSALALDAGGRLLVAGQDATSAIVARYDLSGAIASTPVVEFYNTILRHYFMTANPAEAAAVDAGAAGPGWQRTGLTFRAGGLTLVCRFYGNTNPNPATGNIYGPNSHFYSADPVECAGLKALYTPFAKGWKFESYDFATTKPLFASNNATTCPAGTVPVYRAYNDGFARGIDSNHRLTSNLDTYQQMVASGWKAEGIAMCAPA